jgi:hypothetical protein
MGWWLGLAPATLEFWVRFPNERNQGKQAPPVLKYRVPHGFHVVSHRTCPPLSPSLYANSFVISTAVINTHTLENLRAGRFRTPKKGLLSLEFKVFQGVYGKERHELNLDFLVVVVKEHGETTTPHTSGASGASAAVENRLLVVGLKIKK